MGIGENISQKWKTNYCLGRKILLNKVQNGLRKFFKNRFYSGTKNRVAEMS